MAGLDATTTPTADLAAQRGHPHAGPGGPAVPADGARRGRVRPGEPRGRPRADRPGRAPHARVRRRRAPGGPAHRGAVGRRGAAGRARGRARRGPAGAPARRADGAARPCGARGRWRRRCGPRPVRPGDRHGRAPPRRARRLPARVLVLGPDGRVRADGPTDEVLHDEARTLAGLGTWLPLSAELAAAGVGSLDRLTVESDPAPVPGPRRAPRVLRARGLRVRRGRRDGARRRGPRRARRPGDRRGRPQRLGQELAPARPRRAPARRRAP